MTEEELKAIETSPAAHALSPIPRLVAEVRRLQKGEAEYQSEMNRYEETWRAADLQRHTAEAERDAALAKLAEVTAELEESKFRAKVSIKALAIEGCETETKLAESQAQCAELRAALVAFHAEHGRSVLASSRTLTLVNAALARPADDTALREAIAKARREGHAAGVEDGRAKALEQLALHFETGPHHVTLALDSAHRATLHMAERITVSFGQAAADAVRAIAKATP